MLLDALLVPLMGLLDRLRGHRWGHPSDVLWYSGATALLAVGLPVGWQAAVPFMLVAAGHFLGHHHGWGNSLLRFMTRRRPARDDMNSADLGVLVDWGNKLSPDWAAAPLMAWRGLVWGAWLLPGAAAGHLLGHPGAWGPVLAFPAAFSLSALINRTFFPRRWWLAGVGPGQFLHSQEMLRGTIAGAIILVIKEGLT